MKGYEVEPFGGFQSQVFPQRGDVTLARRRSKDIDLADTAIVNLLAHAQVLDGQDFEDIYVDCAANPSSARNLVSDIRLGRLPTRYDMAIREIHVGDSAFYAMASLAFGDTDLASRLQSSQ